MDHVSARRLRRIVPAIVLALAAMFVFGSTPATAAVTNGDSTPPGCTETFLEMSCVLSNNASIAAFWKMQYDPARTNMQCGPILASALFERYTFTKYGSEPYVIGRGERTTTKVECNTIQGLNFGVAISEVANSLVTDAAQRTSMCGYAADTAVVTTTLRGGVLASKAVTCVKDNVNPGGGGVSHTSQMAITNFWGTPFDAIWVDAMCSGVLPNSVNASRSFGATAGAGGTVVLTKTCATTDSYRFNATSKVVTRVTYTDAATMSQQCSPLQVLYVDPYRGDRNRVLVSATVETTKLDGYLATRKVSCAY